MRGRLFGRRQPRDGDEEQVELTSAPGMEAVSPPPAPPTHFTLCTCMFSAGFSSVRSFPLKGARLSRRWQDEAGGEHGDRSPDEVRCTLEVPVQDLFACDFCAMDGERCSGIHCKPRVSTDCCRGSHPQMIRVHGHSPPHAWIAHTHAGGRGWQRHSCPGCQFWRECKRGVLSPKPTGTPPNTSVLERNHLLFQWRGRRNRLARAHRKGGTHLVLTMPLLPLLAC
jgi:hypothetical protein